MSEETQSAIVEVETGLVIGTCMADPEVDVWPIEGEIIVAITDADMLVDDFGLRNEDDVPGFGWTWTLADGFQRTPEMAAKKEAHDAELALQQTEALDALEDDAWSELDESEAP